MQTLAISKEAAPTVILSELYLASLLPMDAYVFIIGDGAREMFEATVKLADSLPQFASHLNDELNGYVRFDRAILAVLSDTPDTLRGRTISSVFVMENDILPDVENATIITSRLGLGRRHRIMERIPLCNTNPVSQNRYR